MILSRLAVRFGVVLALTLAVTSCTTHPATTPQPEPDGGAQPGFLQSGELYGEYKEAVENFPAALPNGIEFPPGLPENFAAPGTQSEVGVASSVAYFYWLCAWEKEYLVAYAANDDARIESALNTLATWEKLPFYIDHFVDPDGAWHRAVLGPAELGDQSGIVQDFNGACSFYELNNSER